MRKRIFRDMLLVSLGVLAAALIAAQKSKDEKLAK